MKNWIIIDIGFIVAIELELMEGKMMLPESPLKKTMIDFKKQASSFIQEKYNTAKLALTDVTEAEILAEEATSGDSWGPDAKTMTRISEAAYDNDEYWRIIDVIHRRLRYVNYKEWRQSYKTLVLLEFLLTHGPEDIFEEFHCDSRVIGELGKMNYVDERGFNWGACMKKKSQKILKLLMDEDYLAEERSKALTISKEIQGFGNLIISPTASSPSPSSSSSRTSRASSFGSYSTCDSPSWSKREELIKSPKSLGKEIEGLHLWDNPIEENGPLVETKNEDVKGKSPIWSTRGLYTRFAQNRGYALRSLSDIGRVVKKKVDRQLSLGR